jgi:methylaspartate mutase sigma subunit
VTPPRPGGPAALRPRTGPVQTDEVVISGLSSDSHTWNLVYIQLLIEELGHPVVNLGSCVPDDLLVRECRRRRPRLIVLSSVNGHGFSDGERLIGKLRACPELDGTVIVIGGKLGLGGADTPQRVEGLLEAGFDGVFVDGMIGRFRSLVRSLPREPSIDELLPGFAL